jgi:hypothetical protein
MPDNLNPTLSGRENVPPVVATIFSFLQFFYAAARSGLLAVSFAVHGTMKTQLFHIGRQGELERAAQFACQAAVNNDTYFGVCLRCENLTQGRGDSESVIGLTAFWIDIDIAGPAHVQKDLPPNESAANSLLKAAGLPPTIVVHSGHGLHAYWLLEPIVVVDAVNRTEMQARLRAFQRVIIQEGYKNGWKVDNTSDLSRVLRLPGTLNHKLTEKEPVSFQVTGRRYKLEEIDASLKAGGFVGFDGFPVERKAQSHLEPVAIAITELRPNTADGDGIQDLETEFPPALIEPIITGCHWMRHCRDDAETLPEPEWYSMLSVLGRCKDGEWLAHEWSRPYPKYTPGETQRKLRHAQHAAGPITCGMVQEKYGTRYCETCPCLGVTNSPITLGTLVPDPAFDLVLPLNCNNGIIATSQPTVSPSAPAETEETAPATPTDADNVGSDRPAVASTAIGATAAPATVIVVTAPTGWPKPKPLNAALPPVPSFNSLLLPGAFRDYAMDVSERMQVPLDFAAAAQIVSLAGAVGRRAMISPKRYDPWKLPPNLWGGIVSRPGNLKSPLISEIFRPLRSLEKAAIEAHKVAMEEYEREFDAWEARKKKAYGKDASGSFEEPKPERPQGLRFLVNDATIEKLHAILEDNPQGILLFRDELAGWFATLDTKGHERERPFFLEGWNGDGSYTIDRIGRGTLFVEFLCLSVFGGIQPAKLQNYLSDAVLGGGNDDGLVQRLQVLVWPDQDSEWHNVDRPPNMEALKAVERVFRQITDIPVAQPFQTHFDPEAQELFNCWRDQLERLLRKHSLPSYLESHLAKYRSLMPSIALLLHIADGSRESAIPLIQAQRAAEWCVYLEAHARRVYSCVARPGDRAAATLGERIKKGEFGVKFTLRQVQMKGWSGLLQVDQIRLALGVLQEAGWVRPIAWVSGPVGGRPSEVFAVNPEVLP